MKRSMFALMAVLVGLVLFGCQNSKESQTAISNQASVPSRSESDTISASSTSSSSSDQASSQSSSSQDNTNASNSEASHELYQPTLDKIKADTTEGHASYYTYYDIDGNGTDELLTARDNNGAPDFAAIYYLNNGTPTYLAQSYVAPVGGARYWTRIYKDGSVFLVEWSSGSGDGYAHLYSLNADNSGVTTLKEGETRMPNDNLESLYGLSGKEELDTASLDWKPL